MTADFNPDHYPKVDPATGRVTDPENWTPQEVRWAENIQAGQFGIANMTDYQLHQEALYDSQHYGHLGSVVVTPEHIYQRLIHKLQRGGYPLPQ